MSWQSTPAQVISGADTRKKKRASDKVATVMQEFKAGTLRSGKPGRGKGPEVTDRKQAIAIALSEAGVAADKRQKRRRKNESSHHGGLVHGPSHRLDCVNPVCGIKHSGEPRTMLAQNYAGVPVTENRHG